MDQKDLAVALDKSPSVISALVNNTKGPAAAGKKVRRAALAYLKRRIQGSDSVIDGSSDSAVSPVAFGEAEGEYRTSNEWKLEALRLREENAMLRAVIQMLAAPRTPLSSAAIATAEEFLQKLLPRQKSKRPGDPGH